MNQNIKIFIVAKSCLMAWHLNLFSYIIYMYIFLIILYMHMYTNYFDENEAHIERHDFSFTFGKL